MSRLAYILFALFVVAIATVINLAQVNDRGGSRGWGSGGNGGSSGGSWSSGGGGHK